MIEDINNLLNSGEVPSLFTIEEKIEICEKMRILDKQRDRSIRVIKIKKNYNLITYSKNLNIII